MAHVPDTDPYPWPYDGSLDGRRLALLVAGSQPHWLARSSGATEVLATLTDLATAVHRVGGIVVALRHGRPHALAAVGRRPALPEVGSDGWHACLVGLDADLVVDTTGLNGFHGSGLDGLLRGLGRDHLLLGGFCAEITLDTTLRGANDRGYECLVVTDACAFAEPALGRHALSSVTMSGGIFGALGTTESVVGALRPRRNATVASAASASSLEPTTPPEEDR
jgi:nicotinamidase-related amidase